MYLTYMTTILELMKVATRVTCGHTLHIRTYEVDVLGHTATHMAHKKEPIGLEKEQNS